MPSPRYMSEIVLAALVLSAPTAWAQTAPGDRVDVGLVLAVDVSPSVNGTELAVQRDGYAIALRHPDLVAAIAAGPARRIALSYFEWSRWVREASIIPWRVIETPDDLTAFAEEIAALPVLTEHGTSISRALQRGIRMLESADLDGARKVIDISGDGPNTMGRPVEDIRDAAVEAGITINGLPLLIQPSPTYPEIERYYEECVIGGTGAFLLEARSRGDLATVIRRKLILEISGGPKTDEGAAKFQLAAAEPHVDCLVGERDRGRFTGFFNQAPSLQ